MAPTAKRAGEGTCCSQDQSEGQDQDQDQGQNQGQGQGQDHLSQPAGPGVGAAFLADLSVWGAPPKVTKKKSLSNAWEISLAAD